MQTIFKLFEAYNGNSIVRLSRYPNSIEIKQSELSALNSIIKKYLDSIYTQYGYSYGNNKNIYIFGDIIDTEYISKMVNNRLIFSKLIERNNITTKDEFVNYVKNNLFNLYNIRGKDFSTNMMLLGGTIKKGKRGEEYSLEYFTDFLYKTKGRVINIQKPTNVREDIEGIDGKFMWNDKLITLQVKPFISYNVTNGYIEIISEGSLSFSTIYLVLYKENRNKANEFIILSNGINCDQIESSNGVYKTEIKNIVNIKDIIEIDINKYNL